jgi:hypothetical protein
METERKSLLIGERANTRAAREASVVVHFGERGSSGVTLAGDVGLTYFALRVERVELLLEPIVGRFSGVDRATKNLAGLRRSGFRMFALRALDRAACVLSQPKKRGPDQWAPVISRATIVRDR